MDIRLQTFDDVLANVDFTALPVVFSGNINECMAYVKSQENYVWKDSKKLLFGGYWYNKNESKVLLPT